MCLIVFALACHPRYRLVLAANRDEYYDRPAEPLDWWHDASGVLAGRDRLAGGTWLGVTAGGRLAAVTNYRDPRRHVHGLPSRGNLVAEFLRGEVAAADYSALLVREGVRYNGFNLLYGDGGGLHYFSNRGDTWGPVPPGVHGLSNHLLDTPWPKVQAAKARLAELLERDRLEPEELVAILGDRTPFPDEGLPDTGVGLERERLLSSLFIAGEEYGTRSTTVLLVERAGRTILLERRHDRDGRGVSSLHLLDVPVSCHAAVSELST
jgi:uncharacterized protein with NRDE domain